MREFWSNKWVKFSVVTVLYILLCVVWTGNLWMLFGVPIIYDIYISRLFYKYVWHYNDELCERFPLYKSIWGWMMRYCGLRWLRRCCICLSFSSIRCLHRLWRRLSLSATISM